MRRIEDYADFFQTRKEGTEMELMRPPRRGSEAYRTFSFGQTTINREFQGGGGMVVAPEGLTESTFDPQARPPSMYTDYGGSRLNLRLSGENYYSGSALSLAPKCIYSDENGVHGDNFSLRTDPSPRGPLQESEDHYFTGNPVDLGCFQQEAMTTKKMPQSSSTKGGDSRRPTSPYYEMPEDSQRFSKCPSDQEDKFGFRRARNPLYSSMPKLNGNQWTDRPGRGPAWEERDPKIRPSASWGHLGPSDRMYNAYSSNQFATYNPESLHRQYQYQQNNPTFRNIFPYTTLYGRRAPHKYPTMPGMPPPPGPGMDQYSFRRLPTAYKKYYSQSSRRSRMMGGRSSSLRFPPTSRKPQPRIYEIFADESALESDASFIGRSSLSGGFKNPGAHSHVSSGSPPVFYMPQEQQQIWPEMVQAPPSFDNSCGSGEELEEKLRRRKRASRNCMVGWMLGLTALIILALAIALFIQVSKDANELNKLRSAVAADFGVEEYSETNQAPENSLPDQ